MKIAVYRVNWRWRVRRIGTNKFRVASIFRVALSGFVFGCLSACATTNPYIGARVDSQENTTRQQCIPDQSACQSNLGTFTFRYSVTEREKDHLLVGVVTRPRFGDYDAVESSRQPMGRRAPIVTLHGQLFLVHTGLVVDTIPFTSSALGHQPMLFKKAFTSKAKFQSAFIGQHEMQLQ